MPNEMAHITAARRHQEAVDYLKARLDCFSDWVCTIAFYKALHIVEAVFATRGIHATNHEHRESILKRERQYAQLWRHYRPLWSASMVARYLQGDGAEAYRCFGDYLAPEQLEQFILEHHVRQIERSAASFLSPQARAALRGQPS